MSYIQKFQNSDNAQKVSRHLNLAINKKLFLAFLITLAIPVTIALSSQQQTTENHAAAPSAPESNGYIIVFKDKPLVDSVRLGSRGISSTSERSVESLRLNLESQHRIIKTNLLSVLGASSFTEDENPISGQVQILGEFENGINAVVLDISTEQANQLKAQSPYVLDVFPNLIVREALVESVPLLNASRAWGIKDSSNSNITGKGINIAVIDSGVDYTSSDLGSSAPGQIYNSKVVDGYDFVNNDDDPMDDRGHGTHIAGIIAGNGDLKGVAPGANIVAYKVLDSNGKGDFGKVISAMEAAIETRLDDDPKNDISIISLSLGTSNCGTYSSSCGPYDPASLEVDKATAYGITVVVAAGNSGFGAGTITSPGTARTAITVGSINKNKQVSSFSSRGPVVYNGETIIKPDVVAPGEGYPVSDPKTDPKGGICSTKSSIFTLLDKPNCKDAKHVAISGTSMATPHVSGIAALMMQKFPDSRPSDIKFNMGKGATLLSGYDENTQGKGMVDAAKIFNFNPSQYPIISLTPTPIPVVTKILPIIAYQDSYVDQDHPGGNYGNLSKLKIDGNPKELAYLKFDLTPLTGKKIISAKLKLKIPNVDGSGSSNKFSIKNVNQSSWNEGNIKFNNKPTLGATLATFTGKGPGNVITVDVKSAVASGVGSRISWAIISDGSNELILNSKNASSGKPQLIVEYQ